MWRSKKGSNSQIIHPSSAVCAIIIEEIIMLLLYIFIINYLKEISLKYFEKETIIKQNKNNKKVIDQLKEYEEMKNKKYITDEEYEILKKNLLGIDGEEK